MAHVRRAATMSRLLGATLRRHSQGKSSVLPPPEEAGHCRAYLRTPLWPGRTGQDADMRGATVQSTSQVPVVRSDGPGPPESAYPGKAEGVAGRPRGFTPPPPDLSTSPSKEKAAQHIYAHCQRADYCQPHEYGHATRSRAPPVQ